MESAEAHAIDSETDPGEDQEQESSPAHAGEESLAEEDRIPHSRVRVMIEKAQNKVRDELRDQIHALSAELAEERRSRGRLEERLSSPQPSETPKVWTRSELQEAVERGAVSQEAADEIYERQVREQVTTEVESRVQTGLAERHRAEALARELDEYKKALPDVLVRGSAVRKQVEQEYQDLVKLGYAEGVSTELLALRAAFGSPRTLRETTNGTRRGFDETGGEGGGPSESRSRAPKIDPRFRSHYQKLIDQGLYRGWNDPLLRKELEAMRK